MNFSFVIPCYNNYRLLHQLLYDIYRNCSPVHEVIIMDDGNDQETEDGIEWWMMTKMLPIRYERNPKNLGFLLNSNKGLEKATGDIVALVSTDVRIHKNLLEFKYGDEEIWGGRYLDWDTGWNTFGGKIFPYLEGWLLCASRNFWYISMGFDSQYAPNDVEDIDLSTYALTCGYKLQTYPDGYVSHVGAQSIGYSPERESITIINKKKFEDKWIKNASTNSSPN